MDIHKNARLTLKMREQMAKTVVEQGVALKHAAICFNVSTRTAAKWVGRYRKQGIDGLWDLSSKPHRSPRQTCSTLLEKVFALRRLRWNGWRIAHELGLSRATVSRILRRAGMNRLPSLDPPPPVQRYEHERPGDMIHFDIKCLACIRQPGHRVTRQLQNRSRGAGWEYLHVAIDDHSRLSFAAILPDQTSNSATEFFHHAQAHFARFRLLHPAGAHRQWTLLSQRSVRLRHAPTKHPPPIHPALHPAHKRKSRALHPDRDPRMGLCPHLSKLRRKTETTPTMAA